MPVSKPGIRFRRVRARSVAGALTSGTLITSGGSQVRGIFRRKVLLIQATTKRVPCQVRSKTESPCLHRAVVEIRGIPFCEACAREQEAYFAIGELTREDTQSLRSEPLSKTLAGTLDLLRRQRADGLAAARCLDIPCVDETECLALTES
jgi:hypothetical protein